MIKVLAIAGGGAIGALLRYYGSLMISRFTGGVFPYGTLFVNLLGSFVIGYMVGLSEKIFLSNEVKLFVITGLLGAFTTFSTYSMETVNLLKNNELKLAAINIIVSVITGIFLAYAGYSISR